MTWTWLHRLSVAFVMTATLLGQASKSRAVRQVLDSHDQSPYFVVAAREAKTVKPKLLVVMPGGPGTSDFLAWVENGILGAASDDCVGVMVTAVKWRKRQRIVWPTAKSKVPGMRYSTEDYVLAVVRKVCSDYDVDPANVALLAWSSSGPAAYRLLTRKQTPFRGAYIAMSVFPRLTKTELRSLRGRRFVLDQSPMDTTTAFRHVRRAYRGLHANKALVRLSTYSGGHGWHDSPAPRLRTNLAWLFGNNAAPEPIWPVDEEEKAGGRSPSKKRNLLENGSFESGARKGWRALNNSGRLVVAVDKKQKVDGKQALHLSKTGAMPLDLVDQQIDLQRAKGGTLRFSVQIKTAKVKNAWVKLWLYDEDDKVVNADDVNVAQLRGTANWKRYKKQFAVGKAKRAVVQVVMVMGGDVWIDDVILTVEK